MDVHPLADVAARSGHMHRTKILASSWQLKCKKYSGRKKKKNNLHLEWEEDSFFCLLKLTAHLSHLQSQHCHVEEGQPGIQKRYTVIQDQFFC